MGSAIAHHTALIAATVEGRIKESLRPVDLTVAQSWARSINAYRLDPGRTSEPRILSQGSLRPYRDRVEPLLHLARSSLLALHRQVRDAGYVVLMTDAGGITVDYLGDPDRDGELRRAGLYLGSLWSEPEEGTCGVGTCIVEKKTVTIHKAEHFRAPNITLTCTAAPVLAPDGELLAVIDVSSLSSPDDKRAQTLVRHFVSRAALLIENSNFCRSFPDHLLIKISNDKELAEILPDGLLAIDTHGRVVAANRWATSTLRVQAGGNLEQTLGLDLEQVLRRHHEASGHAFEIPALCGDLQLHATIRSPRLVQAVIRPKAGAAVSTSCRNTPPEHPDLAALAGSDREMQSNVHLARRIMDRDIPLLLLGETGTGKEAFARAFHLESTRRAGPFVALNCAAIPGSLIESELFGYKDGAFTGARSKGMRGKILQASGGTLFLDEIGDMPLGLQTRLLRVLAEREVLPLGGEAPVPVDVQVVSATLRNPLELVAEGRFREDLYYRLAGATIKLPAVRGRTDRRDLILSLFADECGRRGENPSLHPHALAVLAAYEWPGNIREMQSIIRLALAIRDGGTVLPQHLPPHVSAGTARSHPAAPAEALSGPSSVQPPPGLGPIQRAEHQTVVEVLRRNRWEVTGSARELGICRATLYRKMKRLNIIPPNAQP
ncbi:sigma-54-dependent Fis family transcriptional regulator [Indioceanicola profundi]|uniref:sigma-54-dependent Fis family transcriptional regulator n=1 Tax=Indioceanicola profundi TaxID=2220096 RepID=UPI0013C40DB5|nr:sigma-54-dependent Fis family transcriptional regulator [Indioceanicola profundi]